MTTTEADERNEKEVQVMCRYCSKILGDVVAGRYVRWEVCDECTAPSGGWFYKLGKAISEVLK